ncbi:MAG: HAMP domain-containing protein [Candidatus Omnitrophica bacterium]|nr:HAMP domain-containing protein [Candidatus Omnitrophota bacterium]
MLFARFKLKQKLMLLIGIGSIGLLALIYCAVYALNQTKIGSPLYSQVRKHHDMLEKIALLQNNLSEIRVMTASMLSVEELTELTRIKQDIINISLTTNKEFDAAIELVERVQGNDTVAQSLISAQETWVKFYKTILETEYVPDIFSGDNPSGLKLVIDTTKVLQKEFTSQINTTAKLIRGEIAKKERNAQAFVDRIILLFVVSSIILIVASIASGLIISATITRPILSLTAAAKTIASGNLNQKVEVTSGDEVGQLAFAFNEMIYGRRRAEEGLKYNYQIQSIINELLKISLADMPLQEILPKILERIISIPWLELEPRGAIFLMGEDAKSLRLATQRGLSGEVQKLCALVPLDQCLCGRAALLGEIVFSETVDSRHTRTYQGMPAHGHYCVPIILEGKKVLGVINLYLQEGHASTSREKELLYAIANIIAGIIERKQTEEALRLAYSQLKETQDHLIEAEKFKAIGQLASGVAHEVKNPLAIILQSINYLENRLSQERDATELLDIVKHNIERADGIVSALMDISRVTKLNLELVDINAVVRGSLALIPYTLLKEKIVIIKELSEGLPAIAIDRKKMEQVFINIFLNSIQAMSQGGNLRIRTMSKKFYAVGESAVRKGGEYFQLNEDMVIVEIEDTGTGIAAQNLIKVFDPFFTTKGPRQGTGLGLSVIKNIVEMHKGFIEIASQENIGTKISIGLKVQDSLLS